jgi:hypothetical protein
MVGGGLHWAYQGGVMRQYKNTAELNRKRGRGATCEQASILHRALAALDIFRGVHAHVGLYPHRGNQWQSVAISGNQSSFGGQSMAISGNQWQSVAISPRWGVASSGNQWQSVAISSNQSSFGGQSVATSANQWQSVVISPRLGG